MPIKIQELVLQVKVYEERNHDTHVINPSKLTPEIEEEYKKIMFSSIDHFLDEREER